MGDMNAMFGWIDRDGNGIDLNMKTGNIEDFNAEKYSISSFIYDLFCGV